MYVFVFIKNNYMTLSQIYDKSVLKIGYYKNDPNITVFTTLPFAR